MAVPAVKSAIDENRSQLQKTTGYDLQQCVAEIDQAIAEARQDKQPNRNSIIKGLSSRPRRTAYPITVLG